MAEHRVVAPEVEGSNLTRVAGSPGGDARDPATPNALKPAEDDSIGKEHTRAADGATTDRTPLELERTDASPGDEAIDAKIAELRETMRGCAELIARHARDDPTKTKLVRDLAHVLNAASEKESRVETERAKGGDETGEGDEPATSESLLESLPEWAGQVPDAIRETRELIRDMEERVKATAARLHDSLTKPPRPFEISADGETGEGERDAVINQAEGQKQQVIKASEAAKQQQINEAEGEAKAILVVAEATAEGLAKVAAATQLPGGYEAVQLRVAEDYIARFGELAKQSNTMILPSNAADIAAMIGTAMR